MPTALTKRLTLVMGVRGTRGVQSALGKVGSSVRSFAKIAAGAALILGTGMVSAAARFDAAMTKSTAIMGNLSIAMRQDMAKAAREVSQITTFSAEQAAESYFFLASAGLDAKQSIAALPTVAKFAQAGMFDMALATDLLTDAQSALGLTIRDNVQENMRNMVRVSDVLVKANTLANATVQQFSEALTNEAGAALKSFNIDVEEGVAVLAAFADQGVKANVAGTSLSRILRLMTTAAVDNADAYKELNIRVFDSFGNIRNMADIVRDLEVALGDMSDTQRVAALDALGFQARVQGVILPLLGTSEAIRKYESQLRDASGVTDDIANKQLKSFTAQLKLFRNEVVNIGIEWGNKLLPRLREALPIVRGMVNMFAQWVQENTKLLIGTVSLIALGLAISALSNPITLVIAAIAGLILAFKTMNSGIAASINENIRTLKIWQLNWQAFVKLMIEGTKRFGFIQKETVQQINDAVLLSAEKIRQTDYVKLGQEALQKTSESIDKIIQDLKKKIIDFAKSPGITEAVDEASVGTLNRLKTRGGILERSKGIMEGFDTQQPLQQVNTGIERLNNNLADTQVLLDGVRYQFQETFGAAGEAAFSGILAGAKAYYSNIQAMSKAFFKGESGRLIDFGSLTKNIWSSIKAAAAQAIADELSLKAKLWAAEAIAALASGNLFSAAKFGAAAALAGGAAAIASGFAASEREKADERLARSTGQAPPLTPEEQAAGVTRPSGGGGGGSTTTFTNAPPQNVTIAPHTSFNVSPGGMLVIGSGGIEEAVGILDDAIVGRIREAMNDGEI